MCSMPDRTDHLIDALVEARESGMTRIEVQTVVTDVFNAPWSNLANRERPEWAREQKAVHVRLTLTVEGRDAVTTAPVSQG